MRLLCACSIHACCLHTSWTVFLIFSPVQGDPRTALGGTVKVVPSRCLSASWGAGIFSQSQSGICMAIARGASTLASFMLQSV